jgi:hypothetical protein
LDPILGIKINPEQSKKVCIKIIMVGKDETKTDEKRQTVEKNK